jgi:cell division protein FtsQ
VSTVAVDPRIRARRASVARDAGRRRLHRLLWVAGVLVVAGAALSVTLTPLLDVESVTVRGGGRTSSDTITEAAGVSAGDALAWFDTSDAAEAVALLPWVDQATVERSWSGEVTIEVTERQPAAAMAVDDGWLLVDGGGRVLAHVEDQPGDVPTIEDLGEPAEVGAVLQDADVERLEVAAAVPAGLRPDVADVTGSGADLAVTLRSGGVIVLDGADDAPAKLSAAAAVLATVTPGCVDQLDVSVPSAPALHRIAGCV